MSRRTNSFRPAVPPTIPVRHTNSRPSCSRPKTPRPAGSFRAGPLPPGSHHAGWPSTNPRRAGSPSSGPLPADSPPSNPRRKDSPPQNRRESLPCRSTPPKVCVGPAPRPLPAIPFSDRAVLPAELRRFPHGPRPRAQARFQPTPVPASAFLPGVALPLVLALLAAFAQTFLLPRQRMPRPRAPARSEFPLHSQASFQQGPAVQPPSLFPRVQISPANRPTRAAVQPPTPAWPPHGLALRSPPRPASNPLSSVLPATQESALPSGD